MWINKLHIMNTQDILHILRSAAPQPDVGSPTGEYVSTYRGYQIFKVTEDRFDIWTDHLRIASTPNAWGCMVYIDEMLSP
jgi:hypothetical protein